MDKWESLLPGFTDSKWKIICCPRSTFIAGRSGSGKTDLLIVKLLEKEQLCLSQASNDEELEEVKIKQLFVTSSPESVKNKISYFKSLLEGNSSIPINSVVMHDDVTESGDIPDRFRDIPSSNFPMVINFQKFLEMLDRSVEDSFFDRFIRTKEVTYDRFCSYYWHRFNKKWTRKVSCWTTFTQITSHIKGGLLKGQIPDDKPLSRGIYIST